MSKETHSVVGARRTILLTGATGYVGGRLLGRLEGTEPYRLRCLTRRPQALSGRTGSETEIVTGDALDPASLEPAMEGVETAYYLIHSMEHGSEFEARDRTAAHNFACAARSAGVGRIIYLGGLGRDAQLSPHLASRQEVGQILRASGILTLEFRASIVIGSGSASYELVRAIVESLPVVFAPHWVQTRAQPIAIEDVLAYLLAALTWPGGQSAIFEIGGAESVTYAELIREYARQRGLRRRLVHSPLITVGVSRALIAPVYGRVAGALIQSLRNETTVGSRTALDAFPIRPRGLEDAVARALHNEDLEFAKTRWSDALASAPPTRIAPTPVRRRLVCSRTVRVETGLAEAFTPIQRIGGDTGWYAWNWFWRLRGRLDTLRGGVGFRRGRRDGVHLRAGDTVDFWRVDALEPGRRLRLTAEMKIPGRLWLQFELDASAGGGTEIRQTTEFDPAGYLGLGYWYVLAPVHHLVFGRMLRGILRATGATPAQTHGLRGASDNVPA